MEEQALVTGALEPKKKSPGIDLMERSKSAGYGLMDAVSLDNVEKLQSEETKQRKFSLAEDYPVENFLGKVGGNVPLMMGPGGSVSKIPAVTKILGTGGKALLADMAGGAAMGSAYGFLQNPKVAPEKEMAARVDGSFGLPTAIGAGAATLPYALRAGGESYYKSAFKKLDSAAKIFNAENAEGIAAGTVKAAELPSEVMLQRGYTGSAPTLLGKIKAGLLRDALPTLQKTREDLGKVYQYPVDELKSTVMKSFDDPTKRTTAEGAIKKAKGYAADVFDKYIPEGWAKDLLNYRAKSVLENPEAPTKMMKVSDFNRNLTDIGKVTSDKGFAPVSPGETGDVLRQQISQGLYTPLTKFENKVVGEKLGPEVLEKFKAAKEETSRMYNMFPDLKDQALKESGQVQFTPLDIMYLTNPYTAAYAGVKEGAQILQNPGPATTIGKGMIKAGKSYYAPTTLTPTLLNIFRQNKKAKPDLTPYPEPTQEEPTDGN
jgi:hypothetical protein